MPRPRSQAQKRLQSSLEQHTKYISCLMKKQTISVTEASGLHAENDEVDERQQAESFRAP